MSEECGTGLPLFEKGGFPLFGKLCAKNKNMKK